MNKQTDHMITRLNRLGITTDDALGIRRCAMTLHRWYELECGDSNMYGSWAIERDEETEKPYKVYHSFSGGNPRKYPVADREKGAIKRLHTIMKNYPELRVYLQTDPRGASVYIYREADVVSFDIESCYSSVGVAVFK